MSKNEIAALKLLRRLYNEDWMWIETTHAEAGRMDKAIHRVLCAAKVNHECAKGQFYKRPGR